VALSLESDVRKRQETQRAQEAGGRRERLIVEGEKAPLTRGLEPPPDAKGYLEKNRRGKKEHRDSGAPREKGNLTVPRKHPSPTWNRIIGSLIGILWGRR